MTQHNNLKNLLNTSYIKHIFHIFQQCGLEDKVRIVGGSIRDTLSNNNTTSISDIDLSTSLLPSQVISLLQEQHIKVIPTGLKHGTVTAVINKQHIEITTLRIDKNCDGRHAEVEFTDNWQQDAGRRDFTINAMSTDISGRLYDYYGGYQDLQSHTVKFIGDSNERIHEDYLRIMRFLRFSEYYADEINNSGLKACLNNTDSLQLLSKERIVGELKKWLCNSKPISCYILANKEVQEIFNIALKQPLCYKYYYAIKQKGICNFTTLLASMLVELSPDALGIILQNLALSNKEKKTISTILHIINTYLDSNTDHIRHTKTQIIKYGSHIVKQAFDILPHLISFTNQTSINQIINDWTPPLFPVTARDLLKKGIQPDKNMGTLLARAKLIWQEHHYEINKNQILEILFNDLEH